MATVSKKIADEIIAGKYDDSCVVKIVRYLTPEGGEAYGLIDAGDDLKKYSYFSPYILNPTTYWVKP